MKSCAKCGEIKSLDEFYKAANMRSGRYSYCKLCCQANRRLTRSQTKDDVFEAYGGYICACCSETEPKFLSIDHINNDGADHRKRINGGGTRLYDWLKARNFPDGFQVLCMNCNLGKHRNGGVCPHQTSAVLIGESK